LPLTLDGTPPTLSIRSSAWGSSRRGAQRLQLRDADASGNLEDGGTAAIADALASDALANGTPFPRRQFVGVMRGLIETTSNEPSAGRTAMGARLAVNSW
jgi:hypothetical protein